MLVMGDQSGALFRGRRRSDESGIAYVCRGVSIDMSRGHLEEDKAIALAPYDAQNATLPAEGFANDLTRPIPVELVAKYDGIRPIGEGSMGTVYRAMDRHLGRPVAIKLLKSDDPVDTRRFMREAQAQARVQHENVCRVYEVGVADGEPYIAMELIDGQPLDIVHPRMTLEEKVKVIREVAAALHEAHRLGLIHRDIKPSNIMVVTAEDGSYKPYVVDFGLARDISSTGVSTQRGIVGTPAYMSPEQAEGTTAFLDRRSDVYSLGATLYDMVAGRTPFVGSNALTLLTQVMCEDAPSLGSVRKGVPRQLETIVMTCLQRDPARRYESARALGEDLQAFLDGGQVKAKPPPLTYVLGQKISRHKSLVLVGALGICIAAIMGGMWLHTRQQAAKQATLARELGEDVKYVELFLRSAYGMPVHDIDDEQRVVRIRLKKIQQRMDEAGPLGHGPGHYALGRGYLALHEYVAAHEHLQLSLKSGYDKPEVHYALGVALGARYQAAVDLARRIGDTNAREAAMRDAESTYQVPALQHLRASGGTEVETGAYIEGLVSLYEKRYDDAAAWAVAATKQAAWFYEAKKLEGDARFASGLRESESGHKDEGYRLLNRAVEAYSTAATLARSDASIHEALCESWIQILKMQTWDSIPYQHAFEQAIKACDDAFAAHPIHPGPLTKKAQAYFYVGQSEIRSGNDPRATFQRGIDAGVAAKKLDPNDAISSDMIGNAFSYIAKYERKLGIDPVPHITEGIANFAEATRIQPTLAWAWNDAGVAYHFQAEYEAEHGVNPRNTIDKGLARFRRAAIEDPRYIGAYANSTYILYISAAYEFAHGRDPRADVKSAVEQAIRGADVNPLWLPLLNNRGWVELVAAQYEERTGADPSTTLDNVEKAFQTSLDQNKEEADTQFGMGAAKHVRAQFQIRKGLDPQKYLEEARTFLEQAVKLDAQEPAIRLELGQFYLTLALVAIASKNDPLVFLDNADHAFAKGLEVNPRHAQLHAALAEARALRAEYATPSDKEREKLITDGLTSAEEALKHNPQWAPALAAKGALFSLRAAMKKDTERADDRRLAAETLDKAFSINALLPIRYKTLLESLRQPLTSNK